MHRLPALPLHPRLPAALSPLSIPRRSLVVAAQRRQQLDRERLEKNDTAPPRQLNFYDTRARSLASQTTEPLCVADLHASADKDRIEHARLVQEHLGVRIAKRLSDFMNLPFIVGCNPYLKQVHLMYADAFNQIRALPPAATAAHEAALSKLLVTFLDDHSNVLSLMAKGCRECVGLWDRQQINAFMDRTMFSRIGIRLLVDHHLSLADTQPGHVGSIAVDASLLQVAQQAANNVTEMAIKSRGRAPSVEFQGQLDATYTYVTEHIDYILSELLKNAFRATLDKYPSGPLSPVVITLVHNDEQILVRVSDQGGGVSNRQQDRLWHYAFATGSPLEESGLQTETTTSDPLLSGLGVGLPVARTYAAYFQGSLDVKSMSGYGVDAFLALNHLHKSATHLSVH